MTRSSKTANTRKRAAPSKRTAFRRAAREFGADVSEAAFNAALKVIAKQPPAKKLVRKKTSKS